MICKVVGKMTKKLLTVEKANLHPLILLGCRVQKIDKINVLCEYR